MTPPLLDGIRIIDLTRVLAGPYCSMMLGDLGADVIKIEAPGKGDDTRAWGPPFTENGESAYFLSANRNKRSLTLNLKSSAGLETLKDLVRHGDVLVENFKTGTLERLGLSYAALQELRPGLIYCTITGYGTSGPLADQPGYDFIAQALGGMMAITGPEDGEPYRVGVAITDLMTGIFACNAILAALFARQHSGEGQHIDMALLDTQVATLSYVASNYLVSGQEPARLGNAHPNIVPYQSFRASDKYFAVAAGNDGQWAKLVTAIGKPEWAEDERYAANAARVRNRAEIVPLLAEVFATRPAAEWMAVFAAVGIPAAPINSIGEVFEHHQVQARQRVQHMPHPAGGEVPQVASPMNFLTAPLEMRLPPPLLGQHNEEILRELLGYDDARINALKQDGLV